MSRIIKDNEIGARIKAAREQARSRIKNGKKLSQGELAERVGISLRTLQNYEKGVIAPSEAVIDKLAHEMGINPKYLRGENQEIEEIIDQIPEFYEAIRNIEMIGDITTRDILTEMYGSTELLDRIKTYIVNRSYLERLKRSENYELYRETFRKALHDNNVSIDGAYPLPSVLIKCQNQFNDELNENLAEKLEEDSFLGGVDKSLGINSDISDRLSSPDMIFMALLNEKYFEGEETMILKAISDAAKDGIYRIINKNL